MGYADNMKSVSLLAVYFS